MCIYNYIYTYICIHIVSGVAPLWQTQSQSPAMSSFPPAIADATASPSFHQQCTLCKRERPRSKRASLASKTRSTSTSHLWRTLSQVSRQKMVSWKAHRLDWSWWDLDCKDLVSWFFSKSWYVCKSQYIYTHMCVCIYIYIWLAFYGQLQSQN